MNDDIYETKLKSTTVEDVEDCKSENLCKENTSIENAKLIKNVKGDKKWYIEWIKSFVIAILLAFLVKSFVVEATKVSGTSMNNTLNDGDRLIISKITMKFRELKRGDIVVMKYDEKSYFIKRVIGLPGDNIQILDGKVYINGELFKEDYINGEYTETGSDSEWIIGKDEYFLMGDNRLPGKSRDSREFGLVNINRIKGVAVFRFYPFGESFGGLR